MHSQTFTELLASVRQGGAILRGELAPSRTTHININRVRAIREHTNLSQAEFAKLFGVSIKTLQNWEQDRRKPSGPAESLLRIIARKPKMAIAALDES